MIGKIFITRTGYDPELGKHVKDPYLGPVPTLGACRPDLRKQLKDGDHIFVISGKVHGHEQFVMGGFEFASKVDAAEAYRLFPEHRLYKRDDGQLAGNIIVDALGKQHPLDDHKSFERRIENYVIGRNPIVLATSAEITEGRKQTMGALVEILGRNGRSPVEVVGHYGAKLTEEQIAQLRDWLSTIKRTSR